MSSISYISNRLPSDANTICSVHVFVCALDVNTKYVFTLNHSKNILKTLPRETPSSLIPSCLHERLPSVPTLGMRFYFYFQEAEGLYTVPNNSARNKPQVPLFEAPSSQCLRCYLALSTPPAGFPSNSGLLTWGLFQTTRDLASPVLPWDIWFHSSATGLGFLFLGRQGQLGMQISSCLGFPLTGGGSGRM